MNRKTQCLVLMFAFLVVMLSPAAVSAWGRKVHIKITSDAYHIMPKAFRKMLGETDGPVTKPALKKLLAACIEPDSKLKDFHNHIYHIHGFKMGNGPFKVEELVKEIAQDIKSKKSINTIAQKLGWLSHYIADLAQPLHTGVATWENIEEKTYHAQTEKDADKFVDTYGVTFDGAHPAQRISARMVYESLWANQYYSTLEFAYTQGKKYLAARPVITACYSRAVNNVVDMWYTAWKLSGAKHNPKDLRPKYYPPVKKATGSTVKTVSKSQNKSPQDSFTKNEVNASSTMIFKEEASEESSSADDILPLNVDLDETESEEAEPQETE